MAQNQYPSGAFRTPGYIRYANPNPNATDRVNLFITDGIRIDNMVEAILLTSEDSVVSNPGYKYIIGNSDSVPDAIANNLEAELANEGLNNNDIVIYNDINGGQWELLFSATNPAFGASGGAFVYVVEDQNFYGYDGDSWGPIAAGESGPKGDTGESVVYGVRYTGINPSSDPSAGQVAVSSSPLGGDGARTFKIHNTSFALGANFNLENILFPNGTGSPTSKVSIFLYNKTNDRTFGFRFKPVESAYSANVYTIDSTNDYDYFDVLIDESTVFSGNSTWTGNNTWDSGDEIYVYAIADGVDGEQGTPGDQGQGITLAADPPDNDQLYVQYLDSNGDPFGDAIPTGIVSGDAGVTGDPGEVGLYMYFTGGATDWEDSATSYTEATLVAATPAGTIRWGNNVDLTDLDDQDAISLSYITNDQSPTLTFSSLNLTTEEFVTGNWYNRPGTLYFYTYEDDYDIRLRSFIRYEKIKGKFQSGNGAVILAGLGVSFSGSSDGSLGIAPGEYGFVLPSPSGVQGTGITFGEIIDNTLYLDYIDADGNTFGRFASIQGISGAEGQMNPFNIRYGTTGDGGSFNSGYINVGSRAGGDPLNLYVSGTAENGSTVLDYLRQSDDIGIKTGYLTVFSRTDSSNFGIFRFRNMITSGDGVIFDISSTPTSGHVAGNLTQIIGTAPTGLTVGDNTALFALSLDGKRGFTGTITGYTFGIEYFIGPDRPQSRTNSDPLEIGDKWYCTTVGLEFTFLGASGDEESVVGAGVSSGADTIWVQTNNARQGRRGPRGEAGVGTQGVTGATGFNYRGLWNPSAAYKERDVVFSTISALRQYNAGSATNWINYFTTLGLGDVTSASFIALRDNPTGHPGVTPLGETDWGVLLSGYSGVKGETGATGSRGTGIIETSYNQEDDELTFTHQTYIGENASTTFPTTVSGIRGPIGPTGPIGGSNNQYLYRQNATTSAGNSNLIIDGGIPTLVRYKEKLNSGGSWDSVANTLTFDHSSGSSIKILTDNFGSSDTIEIIDFENYPSDGGAQTIIIVGPSSDIIMNVGNAQDEISQVTFKIGSSDAGDVYYSIQGEIDTVDATKMRWPRQGEAGIMTVRRDNDDLFITYVLYDRVGNN